MTLVSIYNDLTLTTNKDFEYKYTAFTRIGTLNTSIQLLLGQSQTFKNLEA
jgi:hypothetical protein